MPRELGEPRRAFFPEAVCDIDVIAPAPVWALVRTVDALVLTFHPELSIRA